MAELPYFGEYERFETDDKKAAADLLGADNLAGDRYTIRIDTTEDGTKAYLISRFDKCIGYLDEKGTKRAQLCAARGLTVCAFLSLVAFTEEPKPGYYWGEVALIAYQAHDEEYFSSFFQKLERMLGDGIRPRIDLGSKALSSLQNDPSWFPSDREPKFKAEKGTAIIKDHRGTNDRLIEQARKGNIGCYIVSWGFLLLLLAAIIFGLHSCGVF